MNHARRTQVVMAAMLALAGQAWGAMPVEPPAGTPVAAPPANSAPPAKKDPLPSLDELLGLPNAAPRPAGGPDREQTDLNQKLADKDPKEDLQQAVELMGQSAQRLAQAHDAGLPTQRMQEDVLKKLDKIIEQAQQDKQKQKSKSKQQQQSQQQQQQQQQQQSQEENDRRNKGPQSDGVSPSKLDAQPNALTPAAQAAWGNLPDHVRDALVQGVTDRFSSLYKSMTEAYYRRLAEEPRENNPR